MELSTTGTAGSTDHSRYHRSVWATFFRSVSSWILMAQTALAAADEIPKHCHQQEQVIFSCRLNNSRKVASVCASKSIGREKGYLQYRFGSPGNVELQFPSDQAKSLDQFKISHYFRAGVDRWELSFVNKTVEYVVFSAFEGKERPSHSSAGISVNSGRVGKRLYCGKNYFQNFEAIEGIVGCDPNVPLSCPE